MTDRIRRQKPGDDPILFYIHRLSRSIMRASMAQYLRVFDLGVPQVQILNALGAYGSLVSKEIAALTAMHKALVSRTLSELTELGYTVNTADAADARRRVWRLTEKGEAFVEACRPVRQERAAKLLKVLTKEEQALLVQFMDKLFVSSQELAKEEAAASRAAGDTTDDGEDDAPAARPKRAADSAKPAASRRSGRTRAAADAHS